ncbi:MAG: methyltransferase domain-containing protein [Actinomycetota bacterium]|nr:methyltransferase domain-containing protein [Actinomycetota bacterium]MDQ3647761.1 methyltransferase domain-containing protein [Actinomycetota bacterium]
MHVARLKAQAAETWGKGEYSGLSQQLRPAARVLADACAVSAGQEVLDNAAGDGNFAVICAEEGASVVAADIAPVMVESGRKRSQTEGVDIEWVVADAEDLPFEDARFDCVGSVFGAMLAPRPRVAAEEMFRVVRPGGTVGMTAWTDEGPLCEMFQIGRRYAPPPDPGAEPVPALEEWSRDEVVRERFEGLAGSIEVTRASLPWEGDSPQEFVAAMERHAPAQVAVKEAMPPDLYAQLRQEMVELARSWAGGDGPFSVDGEFAVIVARRPG